MYIFQTAIVYIEPPLHYYTKPLYIYIYDHIYISISNLCRLIIHTPILKPSATAAPRQRSSRPSVPAPMAASQPPLAVLTWAA